MGCLLLLDVQDCQHVLVRNEEVIYLTRFPLELLGLLAEMEQVRSFGPPLGVDVLLVLHPA